MPGNAADEQLTKYLTDVHSIEEQALAQLRLAPRVAGDRELKRAFAEHLRETEDQERLVREQLEQRGAKPSTVKDVAGRVGGWGMIVFARVNPDTPGKLTMHAFSYEHMELAAYELLRRIADRAGNQAVRELAQWIAEFEALSQIFREHLEQTREHQRLVEERLAAHGARPSRFQAGAMRIGALNMGGFFKAQPDTPAKLAGFAYAFEALETGAYELLMRVARRAGDEETASMAERIAGEERSAGERVAAT